MDRKYTTIRPINGSASAAASFASTQARIAAVPATPSHPCSCPSTPSAWPNPSAPKSSVTKYVLPQVNAYVRSFPGRFEYAQWTARGVRSGVEPPSSWFRMPDWTKDPAPNACHILYTRVTVDSHTLYYKSPT